MSLSDNGPKPLLVSSEPQTPDGKSSNAASAATPNNPWFRLTPTQETSAAVVKHYNHAPVRSISTFNFQEIKEQISPAAPFPSIPTKQEVQNTKSELEGEIARLKAELSSFQYERKSLDQKTTSHLPATTTNGIHEFRGLIMTDQTIAQIIKENQEKSKKSQSQTLVNPVPVKCSANHMLPKYRHLVDLPQFKEIIDIHSEILTPLYASKYAEKDIMLEKESELASIYSELDEPWKERQKVIDEYHNRTSEKNETWPSEFKFDRPNLDDAARMKWAAQDTPMILSKQEQIDKFYYDSNNFVENPKGEFAQYKARVVWTEEEKKTFLEKYSQHPKDFAKIAEALPEKSIKEVVEFYYLNRYHMNLKENEGAAKRRGGKKKVITEGSKKNY